MKKTPGEIKLYLLAAAFLVSLPVIGTHFYSGIEGRFLVATDNTRYEPFRESVIYIIHHDLFGAYGVIINKPLSAEKASELVDLSASEAGGLRLGGPVAFPEAASAIYATKSGEAETQSLEQELSVPEIRERIADYPLAKIYLGYAGWGPLQLEIELMKGSWVVADPPVDIIFKDQALPTLWRDLYLTPLESPHSRTEKPLI